MTSPASKWLAPMKTGQRVGARLFCLPYAGSGASLFRDWSGHCEGLVEVCAIRLPGREMRMKDPTITDLNEMVARILDAMSPFLGTPYFLFGHSMGAILAYELAALARKRGLTLPKHLFVSARLPPGIERQVIPVPVHTLSDSEFLEYLRKIDSPVASLKDPYVVGFLLSVLRADFALCESYRDQRHQPFGFPITAFAGSSDTTVAPDEMDPWRCCTTGRFRLRAIPGDHFFIHNSKVVIDNIKADIALTLGERQQVVGSIV